RAAAAATEVKTFSHLMDTLAEGAGSGWAQTFEILIGDFNEAKTLWTAVNEEIGGFISRSADSRNAMLEGWSDLGGRDDLIQGFANIYNAVMGLIKPIQQAFRSIFPKSTFVDLKNLTQGFENFTERHKMGENVTKGIRAIFTAFFLVIKVGVEILKGVVRYVWDFIGLLSGMSGGLLAVVGVFGTWIKQLSDFVKESGAIQGFFDMLMQAREAVFGPLVDMANKLFYALAFLMEGDRFNALLMLQRALLPIRPAIRSEERR